MSKLKNKIKILARNNLPGLYSVMRSRKNKEQREHYKKMGEESIFTEIYRTNRWNDPESKSGKGSNLANTLKIREEIPKLFKELKIRSILDIPCGDFNWQKEMDLGFIDYTGMDIVKELVTRNQKEYSDENRRFIHLDITKDLLPKFDLILCRDLFIHLSHSEIKDALLNIKKSQSKYLLSTSHFSTKKNMNITSGEYYPINLLITPFSLPEPLKIIKDDDEMDGKSLLLWNISIL